MLPIQAACPYCYRRVNPWNLAYQCLGRHAPGRPECQPVRDERRTELTGYSLPALPCFSSRLPFGRVAQCPHCGGRTGARACPVCHTPYPYGFVNSRSPLIGMVGGTGAGKTVYLAVLNHELRHTVRRRFQATIRFAGDQLPVNTTETATQQGWLATFETALFAEKRLPEKTQASRGGRRLPLVMEWQQPRSRLGRDGVTSTMLSFYDAGGEDFLSQESASAQAYLDVADGMIVLLDPWQFPGLRHALDVPDEAVRQSEPPLQVLDRITQMLRLTQGRSSKKKLAIPLAVVFAKMDALFPVLDEDDPLLRTPPPRAGYDDAAGQETHEHVRALLDRFSADDIDALLTLNYKNFRYFAVSALGAPPDYASRQVDERGIQPFRVEEPLLWLLSKFDVVDRIGA